jgi:hypothetical protein
MKLPFNVTKKSYSNQFSIDLYEKWIGNGVCEDGIKLAMHFHYLLRILFNVVGGNPFYKRFYTIKE